MIRSMMHVACCSLAALAASPTTAWAEMGHLLDYSPPASEPSCPSYEDVNAQLDQCLCKSSPARPGRVAIQISVSRKDGAFVAQGVVTRAGGRPGPERGEDPSSCTEAVKSAVLQACAVPRLLAPCPEDRGEKVELARPRPLPWYPVYEPTGGRMESSAQMRAAAPSSPISLSVIRGTLATVPITTTGRAQLILPGLTLGLDGGWRNMTLGLEGRLDLVRERPAGSDAVLQSGSLKLLLCRRWSLLSACGTVGGGVVRGANQEWLIESRDFQLATGGRLAVDVPLQSVLSLRMYSDAGLLTTRVLSDTEQTVHTGQFALGFALVGNFINGFQLTR